MEPEGKDLQQERLAGIADSLNSILPFDQCPDPVKFGFFTLHYLHTNEEDKEKFKALGMEDHPGPRAAERTMQLVMKAVEPQIPDVTSSAEEFQHTLLEQMQKAHAEVRKDFAERGSSIFATVDFGIIKGRFLIELEDIKENPYANLPPSLMAQITSMVSDSLLDGPTIENFRKLAKEYVEVAA